MNDRPAYGALIAVAVAVAFPGCAGSGDDPEPQRRSPRPAGLEELRTGRGATGAAIIRQKGSGSRARPAVIFLHGVFATNPRFYRPWLNHLARRGNVVIYPVYQQGLTPPEAFLANAVAGVRSAVERVRIDPARVVVAGHSAGGALAADYAAVAGSLHLPRPTAVFSAYPGRGLRAVPLRIPVVPAGGVPATTRIIALGSNQDRTVGTGTARQIASLPQRVPASRRRFVLVTDPAADDHLGPQRSDAGAQRVFWRRLDALIAGRSVARVAAGGG